MRVAFVVVLVAGLFPAMAAEQVGTVSSSGTTTLRGKSVPGPVQSLPLASGDEVVTNTAPASILLSDKSSFTAEARSHLWAERQGAKTVICLSQGSLHFNIPAGARAQVCALGRPVGLEAPSEGTVKIEAADRVHAVATRGAVLVDEKGSCACAAMPTAVAKAWNAQKKATVAVGVAGAAKKAAVAVVVAGAAGATTAVGLAVAREDPTPVSPSRP